MSAIYSKIIHLLNSNNAIYRVVKHQSEGRSKEISLIRGNDPFQAMKALVISVKGGRIGRKNILAVIPGCLRLDMPTLHKLVGSQKGRFAPKEKVLDLTGCVTGSVPPFSFNKCLTLIVDTRCGENEEIVFNAGRLDRSVFIKFDDYKRISGATFSPISHNI